MAKSNKKPTKKSKEEPKKDKPIEKIKDLFGMDEEIDLGLDKVDFGL